jgi:hypothetical protein
MRKWLVFSLVFAIFSCGEAEKKSEKKNDLAGMEAALKTYEDSLNVKANGIPNPTVAVAYAEKCLAITHAFPKSKEAPKYMNKAHIIFSSVGLHQRSVIIGDSLIRNYPMYEKRAMVLESLASSYDVFIQPRKKDKVKLYYEMLLREDKAMSTEQKAQIEKRLKYIDLSFEEFIQKVN